MKDFLRGPYFKVHANILNNPKLARVASTTKWTWVELMAVASAHCGFSGEDCQIPFDIEALAWYMRRSDIEVLSLQLRELETAKLIKKTAIGYEIHEWEFWQAPANKAERNYQSNVARAKRNLVKKVDSSVTAIGQQPDSSRTTKGQQTAVIQQSDSSVTAIGSKMVSPEHCIAEQSNVRSAHSVRAAPPTGGLPSAEPERFKPSAEELERGNAIWAAKLKQKGKLAIPPPKALSPEREAEVREFLAALSPEDRAAIEAAEERDRKRLEVAS